MTITLVSAFIIEQETLFLILYTKQSEPVIEYNNIAETFEENHPPVLTFANTETFDGTSTESLLSQYLEVVNGSSEEKRA